MVLGSSVRDNFYRAEGVSSSVSVDDVLSMVNLSHKQHDKAGRLSGGEKRRMEIGRSLTMSPARFFLDEPLPP